MFDFLIFVIFFSYEPVSIDSFTFKVHPDLDLNIPQLMSKYGYPLEIHNVETEDGYILTIYRIPHGKNSTKVHKYPVLLIPGTCGCSENFVATGPDNAIGYYLSDKGFDVWLGNTRGNRHAQKHKKFRVKDKKFWEFGQTISKSTCQNAIEDVSLANAGTPKTRNLMDTLLTSEEPIQELWHEVAVYDTPAIIDYVLKITRASKVFYIGHSQGTTSFLAFIAEKPEYNMKIQLSIQMAPSCFLYDTRSIVNVMGKHSVLIREFAKILNIYAIFPRRINDMFNYISKTLCSEMTFFIDFCYIFIYFLDYSHTNLVNPMHLQLIFQTSPAGCSLQELLHYFQIVHSGKFRQYDYGPKENLNYYGVETPPMYNLSKLTSPISLFVAESDKLVPYEGVRHLAEMLPNLESIYKVPSKTFNHIDFIFSNVTRELVNKPIYDLFTKYLNKDSV